ncbi:MAG: hypothetical protein AAGU75_22550, partial [Bacillota bacterium]
MDIKLKSFNQNKITKIVAFMLCVVFFLVSLTGLGFIYNKASMSYFGNGIDDLLLYDSYKESAVFQRDFEDKLSSMLYLLREYKSVEYINSGNTISGSRLNDAVRELFYNSEYYSQGYSYTTDNGAAGTITIIGENVAEKYGSNYDDPAVRDSFIKDHPNEIEKLRQAMIMDDLRSFEAYQKDLNETKGFSYHATDGTYTLQNTGQKTDGTSGAAIADADSFKAAPAYLIYENDNLTKEPASSEGINGSMKYFDKSLEANLDDQYNPDLKVYFSYDENYLKAKEVEFSHAKTEIEKYFPMTIICALLSLVLLIYLIMTTGKKDEQGNYITNKVDRIFTEIQLFIIGFLFVGGGMLFLQFLLETVNYGINIGGVIYSNRDPFYLSVAIAS